MQLYGRYEVVVPGSAREDRDTYRSMTLGCTYRPFRWTNRARVSLEYGHLFTPIDRMIVAPSPFLGFADRPGAQSYVRLDLLLGW